MGDRITYLRNDEDNPVWKASAYIYLFTTEKKVKKKDNEPKIADANTTMVINVEEEKEVCGMLLSMKHPGNKKAKGGTWAVKFSSIKALACEYNAVDMEIISKINDMSKTLKRTHSTPTLTLASKKLS